MTKLELDNFIYENGSFIYKIINKYKNYYDIEDLYQVAVLGIIKAYKNYIDNNETKFSTYCYKYVIGEIIKYINDAKTIKLNREYNKLFNSINNAKNILSQKIMREPTLIELSLFLEIDEKIINDCLLLNSPIDSLDRNINDEYSDCIYNTIVDKKNNYNIDDIVLKSAIDELTSFEKKIIEKRYYNDLSQNETAGLLGVNQVAISRIEKKILQKLKGKIC